MSNVVRIPWETALKPGDVNKIYWNEVCAWAMENFGLPGDKFRTRPTTDYMDFIFKDPRHALIMSLRWDGCIMSNEELTVEFVGGIINV